jgi:hypothetical protein
MDEVIRRLPRDLAQAALALGSTKLEVAVASSSAPNPARDCDGGVVGFWAGDW